MSAACRYGQRVWIRLALQVAMLLGCLGTACAQGQTLDVHYGAAQLALARGESGQAKRELKLSLQGDPLRAEVHFLLASLLAQEGELDQAIVGFQQTLQLEPNHAVARYNLGTALLWRSQAVAAALQLEQALLLRPENVAAYNNLAKAYFLAGIPELALASYQEALRRDPANLAARKNLALLTATTNLQSGPRPAAALKTQAASGETKAVGTPQSAGVAAEAGKPISAALMEPGALQPFLRDLPHVTAERQAGRLILTGWTSDTKQRKLLDRVLAAWPEALDLTTDDTGDPHRLLEVDATLFKVLGLDSQSVGHNFLQRISVNASVADAALAPFEWLYSAAISYEVNIANASEQRVALLARPHLTTLSGTPARFLAGGDVVFRVAGTTSGDIKPYPFGTRLEVTPTLLRTRGEDGSPRVRLTVSAGRKTILPLDNPDVAASKEAVVFDDVTVTSEAVLALDQTLILTGLNQREQRLGRSGVPGLRSIPVLKYLFSSRVKSTTDLAIIILITPRDAAFRDERNRAALAEFVEKRRAYVEASQGTEQDLRRFKERYPDWQQLAPNRFASHFFLLDNSEVYRRVNGMDLSNEALNFDLLGKPPQKQEKR